MWRTRNLYLEDTGDRAVCINCGQCANVCPVDSITEVYEYPTVAQRWQTRKVVIFSTRLLFVAALGEGVWPAGRQLFAPG